MEESLRRKFEITSYTIVKQSSSPLNFCFVFLSSLIISGTLQICINNDALYNLDKFIAITLNNDERSVNGIVVR